ncbi:MAG: PEP-CTERM sorting domain-containing protein [Akkermansiaceae bacterium]
MKTASLTFILSTTLAIQSLVVAQQMNTVAAEHIAGEDKQPNASYRFSNMFKDTDAVVTVDKLKNIELLDIAGPSSRALESMNPKAIENAAWSPVFAGTGGDGLHYADMTLRLFANGTNTAQAPASFSSSFFGSDLSDTSGGFMMEFAQVTGASSMLNAEEIASTLGGTGQHLAAWEFNNVTEFKIRFGWQGANGPDTGKTFNTLMSAHSNDSTGATKNQFAAITSVPEPSTSFLFILSVFPLAFRRKRQEKI